MKKPLIEKIRAALLAEPDKAWRVQDLAQQIESSYSAVYLRLQDLLHSGFVREFEHHDLLPDLHGKPRAKTWRFYCPQCQHVEHWVLESRAKRGGLRRRRECFKCKHRFTTLEITEGELEELEKTRAVLESYKAQLRQLRANLDALQL